MVTDGASQFGIGGTRPLALLPPSDFRDCCMREGCATGSAAIRLSQSSIPGSRLTPEAIGGAAARSAQATKDDPMSGSAKRSVTISLDGTNKAVSIPLMDPTVGTPVFDIRKLYGDLGLFTYDPGYGGTAA